MRRLVLIVAAMCLCCLSGCVVHDGHAEAEPIWWPTAVVRVYTLRASEEHQNVQPVPASQWLPPLNSDGSLKVP